MFNDRHLEPPEEAGANVTCANPDCERGDVWYEDAERIDEDTWVCIWCRDNGYKTPDEIAWDACEDDDDIP